VVVGVGGYGDTVDDDVNDTDNNNNKHYRKIKNEKT